MNVISTQSMILSLSLFLTLTVSVLADKTINGVPLRYGSLVRIKPQTSNHLYNIPYLAFTLAKSLFNLKDPPL